MHLLQSQRPSRQHLFWLIFFVLIGAGVTMRLAHIHDVGRRSGDERVYTYFAARLANEGLSAMPLLFRDYETYSANRVYPGPNRFGHIALLAAAMKIGGDRSERTGVAVSFAFSILSLLLCGWMGLRFFNPAIALLAVAFLGSSVGELGMARRAWQDSVFGFACMLLLYLACEIARRPRRLLPYAGFYAVGVFCLLSKETAVLAYGICALWLLGILVVQERWWKGAACFVLGGLVSVAISLGILIAVAGDAGVALSVIYHAVWARDTNYPMKCCAGPWYQLSYVLWIVGPVTAAAAAMGACVALFQRSLPPGLREHADLVDSRAAGLAALSTVGFWSLASFFPALQYLRILSPMDGAYCLLAGLGVWYLLSLARMRLVPRAYRLMAVFILLSVALGAVRDYGVFRSAVVASDIDELGAVWIRRATGR